MLVDAGFSFRSLTKRLAAIGEDAARISTRCVVSHEHSDHVAGLSTLLKKTKIPVYLTELTADAMEWADPRSRRSRPFAPARAWSIGDLEIDTFTVPHDAVDPIGFRFRARTARRSRT